MAEFPLLAYSISFGFFRLVPLKWIGVRPKAKTTRLEALRHEVVDKYANICHLYGGRPNQRAMDEHERINCTPSTTKHANNNNKHLM